MQEVAHDDVLGFVDRGSYSTISVHPGKKLDSNYSLNTVDICPVGALTNTDFRFKMRVWFLKETKSFCTSCATGCNTVIGSRENIMYRQTPRENNDVNSVWMCDYGRLNFHYLNSPERLLEPTIKSDIGSEVASWEIALSRAASGLKNFRSYEIAIIASGRMTNEELFLTKRLADALGVTQYDIVPHTGEGDDWEILRDLIQAVSGANSLYMIEDVFKQMANSVPAFANLSLSKIGDLGTQLPMAPASGEPIQTKPLEASKPVAKPPTP